MIVGCKWLPPYLPSASYFDIYKSQNEQSKIKCAYLFCGINSAPHSFLRKGEGDDQSSERHGFKILFYCPATPGFSQSILLM